MRLNEIDGLVLHHGAKSAVPINRKLAHACTKFYLKRKMSQTRLGQTLSQLLLKQTTKISKIICTNSQTTKKNDYPLEFAPACTL